MDPSVQEIEFLDLTDIDESERSHLQQVLYATSPSVKLPWEVHAEYLCTTAEYEPTPYATEPPNGPTPVGMVPSMETLECSSGAIASSPASSQTHHMSGESYQEGAPQVPVMSVPPPVPTSVPPSAPVMTTMYQVVGHSLSALYVGNVTANVNVHSFVGSSPISQYHQHMSQQPVYHSPNDVNVPHEASSNTGRNNSGPRRRTGKPGGKRVDGSQFMGPRNSGTHGHDVLPPPVIESPPTGAPPIQPQSYHHLIPVPPMHHHHHAFQQPFYPPTPQPPHAAPPHIQHPTAQHATGPPIYQVLPSPVLFQPHHPHPASMYNAFAPPPHQPPTGAPIMYSTSPTLPAASVPCTESSNVSEYQIEEVSSERMIQEDKDVADSNIQSIQHIPSYQNDVPNVVHHSQNTSGDDSKTASFSQDSDIENCNLVSTVVVNNSNIIANSSQFTSDTYQNNVVEANNRVVQQTVPYQEVCNEVDGKFLTSEKVPTPEVLQDNVVNTVDRVQNVSTDNSENSSGVVEVKRDGVTAQSPRASVSFTEKSQHVDVKFSSQTEIAPSPIVKQSPGVLNTPFTSTSGQKSSPSTPFQRQAGGSNPPGTPTEHCNTPTVASAPLEKSWASLFNKSGSGSGLHSPASSPSDAGMILAATGPAGSVVQKPFACVRPFQNATTVASSASDVSRKGSDSSTPTQSPAASVASAAGNASKNFPPLGHGQLPAPSMADDPNLYRLGEFLSKYQLDHKAISLQPRGLTNRSNWCYINSTLQALLACPPFYNLMKALPFSARRTGKSSTPIIDSMVQFMNEFVPLSPTSRVNRKEKAQRKDENIEVQSGAAFEPSYIYKMLSSIQSDTFKVEGRQEDAEEFLGCLLNTLNDEMLELIKLVEDPSSKSTLSNGDVTTNGDTSIQSQDEDDTEWKVMGPKNKGSITRRADFGRTPVSDIFRGQLRSRVQRAGDQSTDSVQPFFTLQLDIEKAQSVKDALELLVGRDQLEGVTCSRTNQEVEAWQQVTLEELPLVLVLHLKWFDYKLDGCSKIVKTVEFPIDLKVDGKLMSSNKKCPPKQKQYKLFAVVYHDGKEATKGHYITDVYHVGYGGWVRYDDSAVKAVQETNMLHPRGSRVPYLLYYRRCDTIGSGATTPDKTR